MYNDKESCYLLHNGYLKGKNLQGDMCPMLTRERVVPQMLNVKLQIYLHSRSAASYLTED